MPEQPIEEEEEQTLDNVLEERGSRYGKFDGHSMISQTLKLVMQGGAKAFNAQGDIVDVKTNWQTLVPSQKEALEMIAHKIGRILNGDPTYDDSWVDIGGYSQLIVDELRGNGR